MKNPELALRIALVILAGIAIATVFAVLAGSLQ